MADNIMHIITEMGSSGEEINLLNTYNGVSILNNILLPMDFCDLYSREKA
ncbi:MAG: hypothetical protein AB9891_16850 [Anaerolineaceae bacterium]